MVEKKGQPVSKNRKIFTCSEIEELCKGRKKKPRKTSSTESIAQMDPAVIDFASKSNVTRYLKLELMMLKNSRTAQTPPLCRYDQRIARLNIFKDDPEPSQREEGDSQQTKAFSPQVPNLTINNWDAKVFDHIQNYHRSLMFPQFEQFKGNIGNSRPSPRSMAQNAERGVSWDDQNQFANFQHEQLPSYPRKNFFDDHNRAREGAYGKLNRRAPSTLPFRSAKGNPCSSERYSTYPNNLSAGSLSLNETKSSYDESINKSSEKIESDGGSKNTSTDKIQDDTEPEPEWFSWPASRHDVIDLHGFDDDVDHQGSNSRPSSRSESGRQMFDDFVGYQRPNSASGYRRSNANSQGRSNKYQNANDTISSTSSLNTHQFRKPLHHSSKMSLTSSSNNGSFNRSGAYGNSKNGDPANINPFFDLWKLKNGHQENLDFLNWVNSTAKVKSITEIERAMRNANPFGNSGFQQPQFQSVPQFFSNASSGGHGDFNRMMGNPFPPAPQHGNVRMPDFFANLPRPMPTQEQLQQHTSEIMRNAIMRKKFQDEKKFQK